MDYVNDYHEISEEKLKNLFSERGDLIEETAESFKESNSQWFYRFIIQFLTNLEFSEAEARQHYFRILENKYLLSDQMNRDIGLRVATLDYFLNGLKILKNPKIVEISLFEEMLKMNKEDPKTGCYNSRFLYEYALRELKRAERYEQKLSIILIDIDDFKNFNDRYGHLFGDKILKKFTEIVNNSVREEDIVARFGGDEFAIMLPQTGRVGARSLAERVKHKLIEYFMDKKYLGEHVEVTFSAGIATYPLDAKDYEALVKSADESLYKSKHLGKNRIYDFLDKENFLQISKESERRKFTRYKILNGSSIEIADHDNLMSINGKILDISPSGVLLECNCYLADDVIRHNLAFKFRKLGGVNMEDLDVNGNIVRLDREKEKIKFYLGMEFSDLMDQKKWNVIENFGDLMPI